MNILNTYWRTNFETIPNYFIIHLLTFQFYKVMCQILDVGKNVLIINMIFYTEGRQMVFI